jgi:hypothetical protein
MDTKPKLTKQGIKDLNHYGPKAIPASAEAPSPASDDAKASPPVIEQKPDASVSLGA